MNTMAKSVLAMGCAVMIGGIGVSALGQGTGTGRPGDPPRRVLPREPPQRDAQPAPSRSAASFSRFMSAVGRSTRALGQVVDLVDDPAGQQEALQQVQLVQVNLVLAKGVLDGAPVSESGLKEYGPDEASYRKAFRTHMMETIEKSLELEEAILEGNAAEAQARFKALLELRDESHEDFQADEDAAPSRRPSRERPAPSRERPAPSRER